MPLSQKIQNQSLNTLMSNYSSKKLTHEGIERLKAVNAMAAFNDVALSMQSPKVITIIGDQLEKTFPESSRPNVATLIYSMVIEQMDREADENKRKHQAQGHFSLQYIHQRTLRDQLQDHDMNLLMPKSQGNIEVLAPVNRFDRSTEVVQEGIATALKNKDINHIVIPIGPGHWRGIYLTKPVDVNSKYQLELFDPYGPIGADTIKKTTLNLLQKCGINENQITIKTTGPTHPQQDGYACGDFTCAYSHKKIKEFGATVYNQNLITALEHQGNKEDSLRHTSHKVSQTLQAPRPIIQQKQEEITQSIESKLTSQEQKIFTTTISAQINPSIAYKQEIASLIKNRHSIFTQANAAIKKEEAAQPLSDEELAAKLQAEEFRNAGFKPR
ncbi:hypothetical protein [Legionella drancourtii]|uniref:Legionella ubiquitin-specific protease A domain-containing protein n=1 Tax=Legionella drancourtii LLAP12 TaxID=658187 RepID=G9ELY9_9GAMM|nr:hypothetical protein [Legionella drancourtii]EHL31589.1 hypothetical protein LDG_6250 [Legionella drancourtii LLAP12]